MPSCLASHHICELYHAILFSLRITFATMLVHSTTLPVHQPFESVMEKSGVKTRSSEQTMIPVEADISLVRGSSSKEDSETDDQSYIPPEVYALTCDGYISHIMWCLALLSLDIIHTIFNAIC